MDLAQHLPDPHAFPWRKATVIAATLALVELVALIAIGAVRLADHAKAAASTASRSPCRRSAAGGAAHRRTSAASRRRRRTGSSRAAHVSVLVLNGNGRTGAASAEAARLQSRGYRIGGAANAARHDYARSMVMYRTGLAATRPAGWRATPASA